MIRLTCKFEKIEDSLGMQKSVKYVNGLDMTMRLAHLNVWSCRLTESYRLNKPGNALGFVLSVLKICAHDEWNNNSHNEVFSFAGVK